MTGNEENAGNRDRGAAPGRSRGRKRRSGLARVLVWLRRRRRAAAPAAELRRQELSVVACDLRGFTGFLESATPEQAVGLLREYYAIVAEEAVRHGGTIKDHAGDGVLVLVGGPRNAHASRALALAFSIREGMASALSSRPGPRGGLGLGIGVATGVVTVGTIEAASRLERVAVGTAVNLAARLCARAAGGQILADERTLELAGAGPGGGFEALEEARLKGFSRAVRVFAAGSGTPARR